MVRLFRILFRLISGGLLALVIVGALGAAGVFFYVYPRLPSVDALKEVQLQVPLRIYTRDRKLIAEYGEKRRVPLRMSEIPDTMVKAVLAAEDERFYDHPGVDWQGLTRAVLHLVRTGEKGPGGSTITMQVARNFFLGREKTYLRKLNEILLAIRIEQELTKDEILELYMNKIFLGHRSYGVGAAAQVYYGAALADLPLAQVAMIAGLPKAPSSFNPIANPARAITRRNYVLGRMYELGLIDTDQFGAAVKAPVTAALHGQAVEVEAPYVAEMVRAYMESRVGQAMYTSGYRVVTTIDGAMQQAANRALRAALIEYDQRHGYRGAEQTLDVPTETAELAQLLSTVRVVGGLEPALVTAVGKKSVTVFGRLHGQVEIPWEGLSWARRYIAVNHRGPELKSASQALAVGDVIRIQETAKGWRMVQVPDVEGAFTALNPNYGGILALVGGFDFNRSKFNRVTQARRQPGSSFKPFIYSAAIERGFTPASLVNDAPLVVDDPSLEAAWRPENYSKKFFGPTRLREALVKSRNLVSIRLLRNIGIDNAVDYLQRFGFKADRLPKNLSLSLGSATVSPLELAGGYTVFANGGYRIEPYFIERVESADGRVLDHASLRLCPDCEATEKPAPEVTPTDEAPPAPVQYVNGQRVISAQNAWLMNSLMLDVVRRGTGARAMQLGREDLAGKTGTTNDQMDAWFAGFNHGLAAIAWVGFDKLRPLGSRETGGRAALPIWMGFMGEALKGIEADLLPRPEGLVTVRIEPETGQLADASDPDAISETFVSGNVPRQLVEAGSSSEAGPAKNAEGVTRQLF